MRKAKAKSEPDFQDVANEYAHRSIANMRESLDNEDKRENIAYEDALDVQVRADWHNPGDTDGSKPNEYFILLGTGGPASRILGELNHYCEPTSAVFQYQDWFKPWTVAHTTTEEDATLLEYASQFHFGE